MPDFTGQTVGRYHIIEQLGQGGMATVYKAYDTRLEREVAIKFIRREAIGSEHYEETIKRFEREAKPLAKLAHPNILQVHDYGEHGGSPYLVMAYIPGGTLKLKVGKPMRYTEAAKLLIPIARALEYAHQRNIVHRDVKPANILLTETSEPMLSDFGIAKILETDEATLTGSGVGIGTPEYMSPEQSMGSGVDQRTDIYALGMVFYELVTGRKAYTADTPAAVLVKQVTEPLPRPKTVVPDLPDEVELVLFKTLAKNPEDRYLNMVTFSPDGLFLASGSSDETVILWDTLIGTQL
jgi:serine/threonine protein kinase